MNKTTILEDRTERLLFEDSLPPLTADQMSEIIAGNGALQRALAQEPNLMSEVEFVIRTHVRRPITHETVQELYNGLLYFLDAPSIEYLLTILTGSQGDHFLKAVQSQAGPKTWRWLRRLLALYASPLREGNALASENSHAWRRLNRRVYYDTVTSRWGISLELVTFNGDRFTLEETPLSLLRLAYSLLDSLNSIPAEAAPDLIDAETLKQFEEQCTVLQALYTADKPAKRS